MRCPISLLAATLLASMSAASTDTRISMPLPPGFSAQVPAAGVSAISASMTAQVTSRAPDTALYEEGLDALERYAARSGRTHSHYLPSGYVSAGTFRVGFSGQYYSSYEGPLWGGWWGSPIFVNNYFCKPTHQAGPRPRWYGPGFGVCGVGAYNAVGVAGF